MCPMETQASFEPILGDSLNGYTKTRELLVKLVHSRTSCIVSPMVSVEWHVAVYYRERLVFFSYQLG
jgi:hypothetical protein